jgi:hypothetical protein
MDALFVAKELLLAGMQGIGAKCVRRSEARARAAAARVCADVLCRVVARRNARSRSPQCEHAHHLHL